MSFGIFESAVADDQLDEHRKKLAQTRLAQAVVEVDQHLGSYLSNSSSKTDYEDRVRLAEKDIRSIVAKYLEGDTGFSAVIRKMESHYVKKDTKTSASKKTAARVEWTSYEDPHFGTVHHTTGGVNQPYATVFEPNDYTGSGFSWEINLPDFSQGPSGEENTLEEAMTVAGQTLVGEFGVTASRRTANTDLEDLKEFVHSLGAKTRKRRGRDGFMFPAATGANGAISIRPNGEIVVETVFGGGAGGMQSVYSPNEVDLVKDWIEKTVGGSYRMSSQRQRRLASRRIANSYDWGDKDYHGDPWPEDFDDEDKESDWLGFANEHPANLYDIGDTLEDVDFLKAPIGTAVTVPIDDFDGEGNPGEFDLVKDKGGSWRNKDFKADLHWSEIGQAPVSNIPETRRRRTSRRKVANERFPGASEQFERAGWQSTDPERGEWISPSGYSMFDGSEGSVFHFDDTDAVSNHYVLEDDEFGDNLPQRLTDDEDYQRQFWSS